VEARELPFYPQEDGTTTMRATLDSTGAATVRTALDGVSGQRGANDYRLQPRRMADALIEMATFMMNSGAVSNRGGQRTHINVTCTAETLLGLSGSPAAEIEYGQPFSSAALSRLACDCSIRKILLNDDLVPVGVA